MDIFYAFSTDTNLANNGADLPIGGGVTLKVAKAGNDSYQGVLSHLAKENREALAAGGPEAEALSDALMATAIAHGILVGWEGPLAFKGEALTYSPENALKLLSVPEFRDLVVEFSVDPNNFRLKPE